MDSTPPQSEGAPADRRYQTTLTAIREFEEALAHLDEDYKDSPEWVRKGTREGMESQLGDLRQELRTLERERRNRTA